MEWGVLSRLTDELFALKEGVAEECYRVTGGDLRGVRAGLSGQSGVVSAEPSGAELHVFLDPALTSPERLAGEARSVRFERIVPSLEDVFINLIRKEESRG